MQKALLIGILTLIVQFTYSQKESFIQDSLYSKALNEQRNFRVILPDGYEPNSEKTYDVIYVIDGERVTKLVSTIHDMTVEWKKTPNCIIVGIDNKIINGVGQRNRDLLPTFMERAPLSGGADNFLAYLKEELIPYINKKYPTTNRSTLFGHSHGGTFTIYTLLQEPALFSAYVAADPSLWWDDKYVVKLADKNLSSALEVNTQLFIAGRDGKSYTSMGTGAMENVLEKKGLEEDSWNCRAYKNETHFSIMLKTAYDGLKYVYRDFKE